ncbi:MAG: transcriptional repressor [Deltaproteobacteria bacterium]|nr:transcriptional repressor [Deltaproteobacteria bacterium]MBW2259807.1 transcriptional repressor [Deltaproteobacteria bacterium]
MCKHCDYTQMLEVRGVDPTPLREEVLRSVGEEQRPLSAAEIMAAVQDRMSINKVTLYRILDLLVDKGLVKRLSAGDRAFRYGMGETRHHPDHPHFVCSACGIMECLGPHLLPSNVKELQSKGDRVIKNVELRFEGICESCLQNE